MQSGKRVADVGGGAGLADLPAVLLFVCCLLSAVCCLLSAVWIGPAKFGPHGIYKVAALTHGPLISDLVNQNQKYREGKCINNTVKAVTLRGLHCQAL